MLGLRAFYRKLGFFWKVIIPILVILPLSTIVSAVYLRQAAEETIVDSSVMFAKATIEQFKILRSYYTENVVKKVKTQSTLSVGVEHSSKNDMIPLPATMIHDLSEKFAKTDSGVKLKLYSAMPFPNRAERKLDAFSEEAISYFRNNPDGVISRVLQKDGVDVVRVAVADKMVAESCVACHNSHPQSPYKQWKVGDVRGVLEVEIPIQKQLAASAAMVKNAGGFNIGAAVLLLGIIGLTLFICVQNPVRQMLGNLTKSADDAFAQSSSLSGASSQVASACTEQASAIQQTVSTLDEIRAMSARSVEGVKASMERSKNSHTIALAGKKSVEDMVHAIGEIESSNRAVMEQIDESNKRIEEIVGVITQIGAKTKVINDIVFQTKLLSFNASVEAARAGENGKGFAVVAEEVGNLARMSGGAAEEISKMLDESINRVRSIVADTRSRVDGIVQNGADKVAAGNLIARRCGEVLDQVVSNVVEVDKMMVEIRHAAEEQARGVTGISDSMGQLDQATNQNAKSAEQTSAVSAQLIAQADSLRALVAEFESEAMGKDSAA